MSKSSSEDTTAGLDDENENFIGSSVREESEKLRGARNQLIIWLTQVKEILPVKPVAEMSHNEMKILEKTLFQSSRMSSLIDESRRMAHDAMNLTEVYRTSISRELEPLREKATEMAEFSKYLLEFEMKFQEKYFNTTNEIISKEDIPHFVKTFENILPYHVHSFRTSITKVLDCSQVPLSQRGGWILSSCSKPIQIRLQQQLYEEKNPSEESIWSALVKLFGRPREIKSGIIDAHRRLGPISSGDEVRTAHQKTACFDLVQKHLKLIESMNNLAVATNSAWQTIYTPEYVSCLQSLLPARLMVDVHRSKYHYENVSLTGGDVTFKDCFEQVKKTFHDCLSEFSNSCTAGMILAITHSERTSSPSEEYSSGLSTFGSQAMFGRPYPTVSGGFATSSYQ